MLNTITQLNYQYQDFNYIICLFHPLATVFAIVQIFHRDIFISGLFAGFIIHKFGIVKGAILGSCLFSIGMILSFFGKSTVHLTITFGVLLGIFNCIKNFESIYVLHTLINKLSNVPFILRLIRTEDIWLHVQLYTHVKYLTHVVDITLCVNIFYFT